MNAATSVRTGGSAKRIVESLCVGLLVGAMMGFIDTYGYAITGYTTAELSPIVASILTLIMFRYVFRAAPSILEHFIATLIASGMTLTSTITSGMYITYTMLSSVSDPKDIALPAWSYYYSKCLDLKTLLFYLYATAVSAAGALIAYAFSKHFIEKEKLNYPVGTAVALMIGLGKMLKKVNILSAILIGLILELTVVLLNVPVIDASPALQSILPGAAIGVSLDIFIFLLALLIPLQTSAGVGLGNLVTYLIITPIFVINGLMISLPGMTSSDMVTIAAPHIASALIGFLVISSLYYIVANRSILALTARYLISNTYMLKYMLVAVAIIGSTYLPVLLLSKPSLTFLAMIPFYLVIQLYLTIVTVRVAGEVGVVSQSTLPLATLTLYGMGARGALPYIMLDPYTGVPMPQFIAGSSMNLMKCSKILDIDMESTLHWLLLALIIGAPITLVYGHVLLSVYGLYSPKFNLLRWLPVVTWMKAVYVGDVSSFNLLSILVGALYAVIMMVTLK
ncbi:MAG: hypothetical protein J7L51_03935, partial [Desulfurococcales archaeon]|nr:hypothetical protein [Desulfurococcales archaeon]